MNKQLTLNDLVISDVWDESTKKMFFEKLKKSGSLYSKSKNCVDKAKNIIKNNSKLDESLKLLDYAIDNYSGDKFALSYAYSVKGNILERYAHRYLDAYRYYEKWANLNSNQIGHEFARVRSLLRANKLTATKEIIDLFFSIKDQILDLPSRDHRFWLAVLTAALYEYDGKIDDSIKFFEIALNIYREHGNSLLHKMINKLKDISDVVEVTEEEIEILKNRINHN